MKLRRPAILITEVHIARKSMQVEMVHGVVIAANICIPDSVVITENICIPDSVFFAVSKHTRYLWKQEFVSIGLPSSHQFMGRIKIICQQLEVEKATLVAALVLLENILKLVKKSHVVWLDFTQIYREDLDWCFCTCIAVASVIWDDECALDEDWCNVLEWEKRRFGQRKHFIWGVMGCAHNLQLITTEEEYVRMLAKIGAGSIPCQTDEAPYHTTCPPLPPPPLKCKTAIETLSENDFERIDF